MSSGFPRKRASRSEATGRICASILTDAVIPREMQARRIAASSRMPSWLREGVMLMVVTMATATNLPMAKDKVRMMLTPGQRRSGPADDKRHSRHRLILFVATFATLVPGKIGFLGYRLWSTEI